MNRKERKHFTPVVKLVILRPHLIEKAPVCLFCEAFRFRCPPR